MTSFSADWLALREPADHAARADELTARIARRLLGSAGIRAVDLAAGSGSNVRYLLPRLPEVGHWTLVDHDPALLAQAWRLLAPVAHAAGCSFDVRQADLLALATLPLDGCALVTASALLDLVSEAWLRALAARCRAAGVDVLCALSYDGRIECKPRDGEDRLVRDLVNRHQRSDKGWGAALGPDAGRVAADCFRDEGFDVHTAKSDWVLEAGHAELQRELIAGWAAAAREISPGEADAVDLWLARRLAHVDAGLSTIRVGHVDLAAWIP
ncbi:MAG: class I SAM-dependent methyltransferase [Acidobacteria bacterium]|nr:class I SAM-dependent methyltransferase [Acidobacteriota bacterium]